MPVCKWLALIAAALTMATGIGRGQNAIQWSSYRMSDGLPEPVWHSVSLTTQGKLIASRAGAPLATGLDGYSISNFPTPTSCVGRISDSPGGQRWALVSQGLAELDDGNWVTHSVAEISFSLRTSASPPSGTPDFLPVRQGTVLFLVPDGLRELLTESPGTPRDILIRSATQAGIGWFTGLAETRDEGLWISGTRGLARLPGPARNLETATAWQEYTPPESLQLTNFSDPVAEAGGVTAIAESTVNGEKRVVTFDGHNWSVLRAGPHVLCRAWHGPGQILYAATSTALFQWVPESTNWLRHEELSPGQIFDVAVEPGGSFWLATSDGLLRGSMPLWTMPPGARHEEAPIHCLVAGKAGPLYFTAGSSLHEFQNNADRDYPLPRAIQGSSTNQHLVTLKDGSLLVGAGDCWFQFDPANHTFKEFRVPDGFGNITPLGLLSDGSVFIHHAAGPGYLGRFDGTQIQPLPNPPPLRGDDAPAVLSVLPSGDVWMGGPQLLLRRHNDKWERFTLPDPNLPGGAIGFVESKEGNLWCATTEELWDFDGKKWMRSPARFSHINSLCQIRDGSVWVASDGGLFRYCGGIWMGNSDKEGLPDGAVTALCEDGQGQLWAAGSRGLSVHHPDADPGPPQTYVHWLGGSEHRLSEGDMLNLIFDGQDRWKATPKDRLLFSYRLDQQGWSAFQDLNMFTFATPPAGRHTFQVRAMDRNGNVDPVSATLDFSVITPWFRDSRLWTVLLLGAASALFFAAVALNRHRQLVHSHAAVEQKVAERTRELEIATQELLHSQKMNALGTLAAGIAHDFNNILSIVKGSAQIIEDNPDNPEKIRTRVNRIKTVVQQGAEIVDAMLGFGRGSDSVAEPCDLNHVVADTIKLLGDRFLHEVEVKFERATGLPEVLASREFIQQILLNFIFNAAEAMSSRKRIALATHAMDKLPPDIVLAPAGGATYVTITVRDEGTGIAPEIKARIFEPFFTTKAMSARRGTGLGLSMVYELAKRVGAGLAVQSVVGEGSTFTLILPVQARPAADARTKPSSETLPV